MAEPGSVFEDNTTNEVGVRSKRPTWGEEKTALADYDVEAAFASAQDVDEDDELDGLEESTAIYPVDLDVESAFDEAEATSEISTTQLQALVKQRKMRRTSPAPVIDDSDGLETPTAAGKRRASSWNAPAPRLPLGADAIKPLGRDRAPLATPSPEMAGLDDVLSELGAEDFERSGPEAARDERHEITRYERSGSEQSSAEIVTDVDAAAGLDADEVERALGYDIAQKIAPRQPRVPTPMPVHEAPLPFKQQEPTRHLRAPGPRPATPEPVEPLLTDKVPRLENPSRSKTRKLPVTASIAAYFLALACAVGVFWGRAFVVLPEWFVSPYLLAPVSAVASFILGRIFIGRFKVLPPLLAAAGTAALVAVPTIALLAPLPFVLAGLATAAVLMRAISLVAR